MSYLLPVMQNFNPSENDENTFADAAEYEERQEAARECAQEEAEAFVHTKWEDLSEREQLLCIVSDIGKDAMGFRPRWHGKETVEELKASIAGYQRDIEEQIAQEEENARREAQEAEEEERKTREATERAFTREQWTLGSVFAALGV